MNTLKNEKYNIDLNIDMSTDTLNLIKYCKKYLINEINKKRKYCLIDNHTDEFIFKLYYNL